jgi:hypothetical protein
MNNVGGNCARTAREADGIGGAGSFEVAVVQQPRPPVRGHLTLLL